jgi:hypothetical protein
MMRTRYTPTFKAQVVRDLLLEEKTLAELAAEHGAHPTQLIKWRATNLEGLPSQFTRQDSTVALTADYESRLATLYEKIGRVTGAWWPGSKGNLVLTLWRGCSASVVRVSTTVRASPLLRRGHSSSASMRCTRRTRSLTRGASLPPPARGAERQPQGRAAAYAGDGYGGYEPQAELEPTRELQRPAT